MADRFTLGGCEQSTRSLVQMLLQASEAGLDLLEVNHLLNSTPKHFTVKLLFCHIDLVKHRLHDNNIATVYVSQPANPDPNCPTISHRVEDVLIAATESGVVVMPEEPFRRS